MSQQEEGERKVNRGPAHTLFGLAITSALLTVLFASLSISHAAPSQAPGTTLPESRLSSDGPAPLGAQQATSAFTLQVATTASYWPMEYVSGQQIVGHDIDLMNAIAAGMGATVVYTDVLWGDLIPGLIAFKYDAIISTISVTPEREGTIDFTLPYVTFGGSDNIAIGVRQGDDALRRQINGALREIRAEGELQTIIAAIAADKPEWQPHLPDWPYVFLPFLVRASGG